MRYQSIILYIEEKIKSKELNSGSKLPSVRVLATELNCSKSTVLKAYDELVKNRLAYVIDKTGYFLMNDPENLLMSDHINFSTIRSNHNLLNKNEMQYIFNKMMVEYDEDDNEYEGIFRLRDILKRYFRRKKIFTNVHDVLIASNKQEALHLILQSVVNSGDGILVENPSDPTVVQFLKRKHNVYHFNYISDNMDFNLIEFHLIKNKINVIYITPHDHLPIGQSLSLESKLTLLDLCYKHNVYIIENNMLEDLSSYEETQSLYALDKQDIVFHLKTFDNVYSSQIQLVAVVMPHFYSKSIIKYKSIFFGATSHLEQTLLMEYFSLEEYDQKKLNFDKETTARCSLFKTTLNMFEFPDDIIVHFADSGIFAFIEVPSHYNLETLMVSLEKKNITIKNIHDYFYDIYETKGFILSCTAVQKSDIVKSLNVVLQALLDK